MAVGAWDDEKPKVWGEGETTSAPAPEARNPVTDSGIDPMSPTEKAVWFQRPEALFVNTNRLDGINFASQQGNPILNWWYDKTDVKSAWTTEVNPTMQSLYTVVAQAMGTKSSTGKALFEDLADQSAYLSTQGIRKTPDQLLIEVASARGILNDDGTFDGSQSSGGSKYGTTTATQKSVNLTDRDTAKANLESALSQYLGRKTNPDELDNFVKSLNKHERQNADVTTKTTTTSAGGSTASQVSKGGSNAQQYAVDYARGMEGAAEFQAATGYLDKFLTALKNPLDVVG
jgi:hypothetical protein